MMPVEYQLLPGNLFTSLVDQLCYGQEMLLRRRQFPWINICFFEVRKEQFAGCSSIAIRKKNYQYE